MNDKNHDTHDARHSGAVLSNIAAVQACTASLMTCIRETAGQEDASLDAFLPPLRNIILQLTTFGCAYLESAMPPDTEE